MNLNDKDILYHSTNRNLSNLFSNLNKREKVSFKNALFLGLAPDNGLYNPMMIPKISKEEIMMMKDLSYSEVAFHILSKFVEDEIPTDVLNRILNEIYKFEVPIERVDEHINLLRLDRGPTCSFKDFGALFMAKVVEYLRETDKLNLLVATSGDTGSAIGNAFKDIDGIKVYILYPKDEVSTFQKKQLHSFGKNVKPIAIKGKFDDCQRLVKTAFADPTLKEFNLFSANSINIGRLIPQIVYYFYAYAKVSNNLSPIIFSVPSGNLGNSLGCELARRMGLPIKRIIIATNENKVFPEFLSTGIYKKISPSINCLSNAMNVGHPSNIARYFDLYGGTIDKEGNVYKMPDIEEMRKHISSFSISDEETVKIIKIMYKKYNVLLEPHGAVAIAALEKYFRIYDIEESICLETAHPFKFYELLSKELMIEVEAPFWLDLSQIEINDDIDVIEDDYEQFKKIFIRAEGERWSG